ncbi:hypothetical protein COU17_02170 [Candidatus Kaiserbacteria bacterium CG10_big_fil_rev_8_21_14_0_10_49_17]|uniref:Uncharacterized protein n=1 Tax=Candidatus Kaiserbacteria bacterium CG10_big_fil_rev_8_21_14_0_10_49_17 TaxID=1974609 RepID=A0A2M6WE59_9BACT|nr:MAG: hypothetical protein COU17_02170 [Candidatus Kaiserbacteria bacterium CG10_big_fil_rev_8_21_14_0_10_49_17]
MTTTAHNRELPGISWIICLARLRVYCDPRIPIDPRVRASGIETVKRRLEAIEADPRFRRVAEPSGT